jgi:hypothetical protein
MQDSSVELRVYTGVVTLRPWRSKQGDTRLACFYTLHYM